MNFINISEETLKEFKELLTNNDINKTTIRINLAGNGCGGPVFNIVVDDAKEDDVTCNVGDLTFILNNDLHDKYGDFIMEGTHENDRGLVLKPVNAPSGGGCGSCGGGCS